MYVVYVIYVPSGEVSSHTPPFQLATILYRSEGGTPGLVSIKTLPGS
jgi:hypothetical protein